MCCNLYLTQGAHSVFIWVTTRLWPVCNQLVFHETCASGEVWLGGRLLPNPLRERKANPQSSPMWFHVCWSPKDRPNYTEESVSANYLPITCICHFLVCFCWCLLHSCFQNTYLLICMVSVRHFHGVCSQSGGLNIPSTWGQYEWRDILCSLSVVKHLKNYFQFCSTVDGKIRQWQQKRW